MPMPDPTPPAAPALDPELVDAGAKAHWDDGYPGSSTWDAVNARDKEHLRDKVRPILTALHESGAIVVPAAERAVVAGILETIDEQDLGHWFGDYYLAVLARIAGEATP